MPESPALPGPWPPCEGLSEVLSGPLASDHPGPNPSARDSTFCCPSLLVPVCVCVCVRVCARVAGGQIHSGARILLVPVCTCKTCLHTCVYMRVYVQVHQCEVREGTPPEVVSGSILRPGSALPSREFSSTPLPGPRSLCSCSRNCTHRTPGGLLCGLGLTKNCPGRGGSSPYFCQAGGLCWGRGLRV